MTGDLQARVQRCLFPGIVWLLALGFLIEAHSYSPAAGAVPKLIGWATLLLTSIDLYSRMSLRPIDAAGTDAAGTATDVADTRTRVTPARTAIAVSGILLLVAGMTLVGILASVPIFILIALRWGGDRRLTTSLLTAVLLTGLLWATFSGLMRLDLYPGLLFGGDW